MSYRPVKPRGIFLPGVLVKIGKIVRTELRGLILDEKVRDDLVLLETDRGQIVCFNPKMIYLGPPEEEDHEDP